MRAWFSCSGAELLSRDPADTVGRVAAAQAARGLSATAEQAEAWHAQLEAAGPGPVAPRPFGLL
jgi:hypothetical protein